MAETNQKTLTAISWGNSLVFSKDSKFILNDFFEVSANV
jgi:hypothetical protein